MLRKLIRAGSGLPHRISDQTLPLGTISFNPHGADSAEWLGTAASGLSYGPFPNKEYSYFTCAHEGIITSTRVQIVISTTDELSSSLCFYLNNASLPDEVLFATGSNANEIEDNVWLIDISTSLLNGESMAADWEFSVYSSYFGEQGTIDLATVGFNDPGPPWRVLGDGMYMPRTGAKSILTKDGLVLTAAGQGGEIWGALKKCEVFDPQDESTAYITDCATARSLHVTALLPSGKVIIVGGAGGGGGLLTSSEIYDPNTNSWSAGPVLPSGICSVGDMLLNDGRLLLCGGYRGEPTVKCYFYNEADNTITLAPSMAVSRSFNIDREIVKLNDGRVLVIGGDWDTGTYCEIFNPETNCWLMASGIPSEANGNWVTTRLRDGRVFVTGGTKWDPEEDTKQCWFYNPDSNVWSAAPDMGYARGNHQATLLPNGKVLVVGGLDNPRTWEIFDPETNSWQYNGTTNQKHWGGSITILPSGKILHTNGQKVEDWPTNVVEVFSLERLEAMIERGITGATEVGVGTYTLALDPFIVAELQLGKQLGIRPYSATNPRETAGLEERLTTEYDPVTGMVTVHVTADTYGNTALPFRVTLK